MEQATSAWAAISSRFSWRVRQRSRRRPGNSPKSLLEELSTPIRIKKTVAAVVVSIGILMLGEQCADSEWFLRRADVAMYEAKRCGRYRCVGFNTSIETRLQQRDVLEAELRQEIENGELAPHCAPAWDVRMPHSRYD